jgi:hypothetical protein
MIRFKITVRMSDNAAEITIAAADAGDLILNAFGE